MLNPLQLILELPLPKPPLLPGHLLASVRLHLPLQQRPLQMQLLQSQSKSFLHRRLLDCQFLKLVFTFAFTLLPLSSGLASVSTRLSGQRAWLTSRIVRRVPRCLSAPFLGSITLLMTRVAVYTAMAASLHIACGTEDR